MFTDEDEHLHGLNGIEFFDFFLQTCAPSDHIRIVLALEAIHPEGRRKFESGILKTFLDGNTMPFVDISTSGTALDRHPAAGAIECYLAGLQRQHTAIFKQNDTFRCSTARKRFMFLFTKRFFR